MRRVVITGIGAVTPLGNTIWDSWDALKRGISGIWPITRFDASGLETRIAGEVKGFDVGQFLSKRHALRHDPFVHYAVAAALMALEDAGITPESEFGVVIGSSRGGITTIERNLERHINLKQPFSAYLAMASTANMAASEVSIRLGLQGPCMALSTACASGANAIGEAMHIIKRRGADVMLAGGSEAPITRVMLGGYGSARVLSRRNDEPGKASRPFDIHRDGFVLSEGAGVVILEELNHAIKRGANIYAEITGYATTADACHETMPSYVGEALCIRKAIEDAGLFLSKTCSGFAVRSSEKPKTHNFKPIGEIGLINAHATSTPLGDIVEAKAIKEVFGDAVNKVSVTANKSMTGHMLGASGAVEAIFTALSIKEGIIPPSINIDEVDGSIQLNIARRPLTRKIKAALTTSFGFGGVNACLVLFSVER